MTSDYRVPANSIQRIYEIKKSRFIARAHYASSREQALDCLAQAKADYPDARHHCWAYYIGNPHSPSLVAFSDDGEPGGTAGKPILNVLQHKDIGDLMLIVIRYFGGIKLGAGGLVRAYSHAAQLAIDELPTKNIVNRDEYTVTGDFKIEQPLRHWLDAQGGAVKRVDYGDGINVRVLVPVVMAKDFSAFILAHGAMYKLEL